MQAANGEEEDDEGGEDQGGGLGQQGQAGEKARNGPPDGAVRFSQPVEGGHQGQEAEGRQQRVGVEEPGVADEKWVKGQQADSEERHAPVEEACQQWIEGNQAQRGDQRDTDAAPGEEKDQVAESLPVLRGQPGQAADPVQVGKTLSGVEDAAGGQT